MIPPPQVKEGVAGSGVQELQEYRSAGVQEYRSTGVQECRSTGDTSVTLGA
jgi:hypothetical protein